MGVCASQLLGAEDLVSAARVTHTFMNLSYLIEYIRTLWFMVHVTGGEIPPSLCEIRAFSFINSLTRIIRSIRWHAAEIQYTHATHDHVSAAVHRWSWA